MSNNLNVNNGTDRNDKESALRVLKHFQKKNKKFVHLVQKFQLEWSQPVLEERIETDEIIKKIKNIKTNKI